MVLRLQESVQNDGSGGCRVVSTSVDGSQLSSVLWGELNRHIDTCRINLPIEVNHLHVKKVVDGVECLCHISKVK